MLVRQARQKSLVMEPEASLLLKKYFVASRRARANDGVKGKEILKRKLWCIQPSIFPKKRMILFLFAPVFKSGRIEKIKAQYYVKYPI